MFHLAVAKEFAMELDSASMQFEKVRLMPQAGSVRSTVFLSYGDHRALQQAKGYHSTFGTSGTICWHCKQILAIRIP